MGFSFRHISILVIFLLTACTGTGGTPFGGSGGPSSLDNQPGGSAAVGDTGLDEAAATPDRTGAKIDLDPTGDYKYLFLARMDMAGQNPYDPEKCQTLGDCTVRYLTCEDYNQLTVTWEENSTQCHIAEWVPQVYRPNLTQLDCRHMLPCKPFQVAPHTGDLAVAYPPCGMEYRQDQTIQEAEQCRLSTWPEDLWMDCPKFHEHCDKTAPKIYVLPDDPEAIEYVVPPCGVEYHQVEAIQDGDQCRLPSWPEDLWMDCPSFHEHCEQTSPQLLNLVGDQENHQTSPTTYQGDPNQIYLNNNNGVDLQVSPPLLDL